MGSWLAHPLRVWEPLIPVQPHVGHMSSLSNCFVTTLLSADGYHLHLTHHGGGGSRKHCNVVWINASSVVRSARCAVFAECTANISSASPLGCPQPESCAVWGGARTNSAAGHQRWNYRRSGLLALSGAMVEDITWAACSPALLLVSCRQQALLPHSPPESVTKPPCPQPSFSMGALAARSSVACIRPAHSLDVQPLLQQSIQALGNVGLQWTKF